MAGDGTEKKGKVDKLGCPVVGSKVTVTTKYGKDELGKDSLTYFSCNREGTCGIPDWDPCPLYVTARETKGKKKKK